MEKAREFAVVTEEKNEKPEVEIKPWGINLKGEEAGKLGAQLNDFVSPFSNLFGIAGDWVGDVRAKRKENIDKTIMYAEKISKKHKKKLKLPPLKFLSQWTEGASLENFDEGESLSKLWANLLINAGDGFDSGHILFARLLKEMTKSEADLLKTFAWKAQENFMGSRLGHCLEAEEHFESCFGGALAGLFHPETDDFKDAFDEFLWRIERPGILVSSLIMSDADIPFGDVDYLSHDGEFESNNSLRQSANLLISLGLISLKKGEILVFGNRQELFGSAYCITPTGVEFLKACGVEDQILERQSDMRKV